MQSTTETTKAGACKQTSLAPLFELGDIDATYGALKLLNQNGQSPIHFVCRHVTGDWSEMDANDQTQNKRAAINGSRVFSSYATNDGQKLYVITEADRSKTTLLLPSEY